MLLNRIACLTCGFLWIGGGIQAQNLPYWTSLDQCIEYLRAADRNGDNRLQDTDYTYFILTGAAMSPQYRPPHTDILQLPLQFILLYFDWIQAQEQLVNLSLPQLIERVCRESGRLIQQALNTGWTPPTLAPTISPMPTTSMLIPPTVAPSIVSWPYWTSFMQCLSELRTADKNGDLLLDANEFASFHGSSTFEDLPSDWQETFAAFGNVIELHNTQGLNETNTEQQRQHLQAVCYVIGVLLSNAVEESPRPTESRHPTTTETRMPSHAPTMTSAPTNSPLPTSLDLLFWDSYQRCVDALVTSDTNQDRQLSDEEYWLFIQRALELNDDTPWKSFQELPTLLQSIWDENWSNTAARIGFETREELSYLHSFCEQVDEVLLVITSNSTASSTPSDVPTLTPNERPQSSTRPTAPFFGPLPSEVPPPSGGAVSNPTRSPTLLTSRASNGCIDSNRLISFSWIAIVFL